LIVDLGSWIWDLALANPDWKQNSGRTTILRKAIILTFGGMATTVSNPRIVLFALQYNF
jgi:hypothetical protein